MGDQQQGSESLSVCYQAVPASAAKARAAVARLAAAHGAGEADLDRIRLTVSEAVANSIMHAYGEGGGGIQITAAVIAGELTVVVSDDGCGLGEAAESPGLGYGLRVIAEGCDSFSILTRSSGGTQIEMRFVLDADASAEPAARQGAGEPVSCEDR